MFFRYVLSIMRAERFEDGSTVLWTMGGVMKKPPVVRNAWRSTLTNDLIVKKVQSH